MAITLENSLPDPSFKCEIAVWKGVLSPCAHLWQGNHFKEPVLNSTPLRKVNWATLFAYMHRRFGPPHSGGDDYKDLSASWVLTSPDALVYVNVSPSLSGAGFSFEPYYQRSEESARASRFLDLPPDRVAEVKAAYRSVLLDLLRPVGVRDSLINAMGELGQSELDSALQSYGEEGEGEAVYVVKRHSSCGFSMPAGLFGGAEWTSLCTIVQSMGDGNIQAGRSAVIAALRKDVFEEAANQPNRIKRLMLMANYNLRDTLKEGLRISDAEMLVLDAEIQALSGADAYKSSVVSDLALDDAAVAIGLLHCLGLGANGLKKRIQAIQIDKAVDESYGELQSLPCKEFPVEAIPIFDSDKKVDLAEHMRSNFLSIGRGDLLQWLETTLARPAGPQALAQIAWYIQNQNQNAESAKAPPAREKATRRHSPR